jgi:hypothetical protein
MWQREFKDYPPDSPLIHHRVEPGHGITGCEMHEVNGWGERYRQPLERRPTILRLLIKKFQRNR